MGLKVGGEAMGTQRHSWWQNIKPHPLISVGIVVTIVALIVFTLAVFKFGWDWTGFTGGESNITITSTSRGITTAKELQPAKTFWDWLELLGVLAIPVVVGFGAAWFTRTQQLRDQEHEKLQRARDQEAARIQHDRDQQLADQRAESERKAAEQQAELERELTRDNQQEILLQAYIDKMSELLLESKLRESAEDDEVRKIARVRTVTVLNQLDARRVGYVFTFLREAGLMLPATLRSTTLNNDVVSLEHADFSRVKWGQASLGGGANLFEASLRGAQFMGADLRGAYLNNADLRGAHFLFADLGNLRGADLTGADLTGANLSDAEITEEQLNKAKWLKDATMPDGSRHP